MYRFIIWLHLFFFLFTRSFLIWYAYISIKLIDYIFLSSFELKAILLIFSVITLRLSLLNLSCVFNIDLLFFVNSLWSFLRHSMSVLFFRTWSVLFSIWVASNSYHNLQIQVFFLWHTFLCLLLFYLHCCYLLSNCNFLLII